MTQNVFAQPPQVPSTIKRPLADGMRVPVPDPPLITPAELQKLTGGPTLVTLSGTVPSADVVKALLEAARTSNSTFTLGIETLSVDWKQTPFWVAAAEIEKVTGNTFNSQFGNGLSLGRINDGKGMYGVGLNGKLGARTPFLTLVARSISRTETNEMPLRQQAAEAPDVAEKKNQIQLMFSIYLDPRLKTQSVTVRDVVSQKRGEAATVANENDRFGYSYGDTRGPIIQQMLSLPGSIGAGTTLSRISGVLHTTIVTGTEAFSIPDIIATPTATKEIGGTQWTLQNATITQNALSVRVSAQWGGAPGANRRLNDVFSLLSIRDARGQELQRGGGSSSSDGTKASAEFSFSLTNFRNEATVGPYSLEWKVVTEVKSLDVPFELRDVVVP